MHLLGLFSQLSKGRGYSMMGPLPITYQAIDAFERVTGVSLTGEEMHGIFAIDAAYCVAAQCKVDTKAKKNGR